MLDENDSADQVRLELRKTQQMIGSDGSDGKDPSGLMGRIVREGKSRRRSILAVVIAVAIVVGSLALSVRYNDHQTCLRGNARSNGDVERLYAQDREYSLALGGTDAEADAVTRKILADKPPLHRSCPSVWP